MRHAHYQEAEKKAAELLDQFQIDEPIIPIFEIAQRLGFILEFVKMPDNLNNISGIFDRTTNIMYINYDDPPNRQTFTVAHHLGHILLGHEINDYDIFYRYETPIDKDPIEEETNFFAAHLMVPEKMLKQVMKKYLLTEHNIDLLAPMFGVSFEVIKYRLKCLNLTPQ